MPRPYNRAACNTCRNRKVRCDETLPICTRCQKTGRHCDRSEAPLRFQIINGRKAGQDDSSESPALLSPDVPRKVLESSRMADYFQHYITDLAPWYDLSDGRCTFGTTVPRIALDDPLLFSAVMALSVMHVSNTISPSSSATASREVAEFYHGRCIRLLIALQEGDRQLEGGVALAATCLLRSYEILDTAQDADPNRHLAGAYSLASFPFQHHENSIPTTILSRGLFAAGFWNYLREDITFSLFRGCSLKIDLDRLIPHFGGVLSPSDGTSSDDQDQLNAISLILGRIINAAFTPGDGSESDDPKMKEETWTTLLEMVRSWRAALPLHFQPFSWARAGPLTELPMVRVLHDCHAASHHYYLVSLMILGDKGALLGQAQNVRSVRLVMGTDASDGEVEAEDLLEHLALRICGIAFTSNTPTVLVNAFGPISYASRWIRNPAARKELARNLLACKKSTGWPVERIMSDTAASQTTP
ncbi:hypothetical protein GE09DRAFT_303521 [Coniochaeta sp. 2T2.1]|nr:hypothetical protein GE09DRAFT_303521 [Coniochaeta sp. 2T2.1]